MKPLRIVMLNDVGFIGGAGNALRRQVQSFLLGGHAVSVVCWLENPSPHPGQPHSRASSGEWLGIHGHPHLHIDKINEPVRLVSAIRDAVLELRPDVVVAGNLHWAKWPLAVLPAIQATGVPVVAYLHDCHWLTGRCAYTGSCRRFELDGCDASCPTPTEYPSLAPADIAAAYAERRQVFTGPDRVRMVANSRWMHDMTQRAFKGQAAVETVHLGLDTALFSPFARVAARRMLALGRDRFIALVGAVNLSEGRKGGPLLHGVLSRLAKQDRPPIEVIAFGVNSEHLPQVKSFGQVSDERVMPLLYNAADVFINCSSEESFGQTALEASACGVPVIALKAGGLTDIVEHGKTGVLIDQPDPELFVSRILELASAQELSISMSSAARKKVSAHFSLDAQYARWERYFTETLALA